MLLLRSHHSLLVLVSSTLHEIREEKIMDRELETYIIDLMNMSQEELLIKLGVELNGDSFFSVNNKELRKIAKNWLYRQHIGMSESLCSDSRISSLHQVMNEKNSKIQLVAAVADLISPFVIGFPPWTVSVLLVREGIDTLCKEYWG